MFIQVLLIFPQEMCYLLLIGTINFSYLNYFGEDNLPFKVFLEMNVILQVKWRDNTIFLPQLQQFFQMIFNIYELDETPFLKHQTLKWKQFKQKQKYLPFLRNLSYRYEEIMSKIFIYYLQKRTKEGKIIQKLNILTQKQIINLDQLYQMLNQSLQQNQFSTLVSQIKMFEQKVHNIIKQNLSKVLISYKTQNYLKFSIYHSSGQFLLKAKFQHYDFQLDFETISSGIESCQSLKISHPKAIEQLKKKYAVFEQNSKLLPVNAKVSETYRKFYEQNYFKYDEYVLQLQVFKNYPLLRTKIFLPLTFSDGLTQQRLEGPIFSNSDPQCMYGHFNGYNANSIVELQGNYCEVCQLQIQQLQQNQLLESLRDNVLNPKQEDILYCPELNRFKIISKSLKQQKQQQSKNKYDVSVKYLNYMHMMINMKRTSQKNRPTFGYENQLEYFSLTFELFSKKFIIMDPVRGKNCFHYEFTDMRLFYLSKKQNSFKCPICNKLCHDTDIIYLHEVKILLKYLKYKTEQSPELILTSKAKINHKSKQLFLEYQNKQKNQIKNNTQQIKQYYPTLIDPYINFPQHTLGIKDKDKKKKYEKYMFNGMNYDKDEIQEDNTDEEQDQE